MPWHKLWATDIWTMKILFTIPKWWRHNNNLVCVYAAACVMYIVCMTECDCMRKLVSVFYSLCVCMCVWNCVYMCELMNVCILLLCLCVCGTVGTCVNWWMCASYSSVYVCVGLWVHVWLDECVHLTPLSMCVWNCGYMCEWMNVCILLLFLCVCGTVGTCVTGWMCASYSSFSVSSHWYISTTRRSFTAGTVTLYMSSFNA